MTSRIDFNALLLRQAELENTCLKEGAERFKKAVLNAEQKGRASTTGAARKLLLLAMEKTEATLQAIVTEANTPGRRGRRHIAVKWLERVGCDVAAYITCKVILDNIGQPGMLFRTTCYDITSLITDELRFRRYQELCPGLFKYRLSQFSTSSYAHMARSLGVTMGRAVCVECHKQGKEECEHLDMSDLFMLPGVALQVGGKLIDAFMVSTGLCASETNTQRKGRGVRRETLLKATPATRAWLDARNEALTEFFPVNMPMVVPPLPWTPTQRGGYRFAMRDKYPMVRRTKNGAPKEQSTAPCKPVVYDSLNRVQETAWRVNDKVLSVIERMVQRGGGVAGIPLVQNEPEPKKPPTVPELEAELQAYRQAKRRKEPLPTLTDEAEAYREEWRDWKTKAGEIKDKNHERKLKAKTFFDTLGMALRIRDEQAIWFPYNLDFRGRVYPIATYLSPQGDDLSKGLLTFAEGKPLGRAGACWLAIHGANCLKDAPDGTPLNKATLNERIGWIVEHSEAIERVAYDPIAHPWWMDADKPLQFLAFCIEWAGYQQQGESYVCSLPVAMDGTCNGLQHFAAMLSDERAAEAVNVLPNARPKDIYGDVTEDVLQRLEAIASDEPLAAKWLASGVVTRKFCKRPAMTFSYGSKKYGFKAQIEQYCADDRKVDVKALRQLFSIEKSNKLPVAAGLIADLIWESLKVYVPRAFEGMAWLQQIAKLAVHNGECVSWVVPATGFVVRQSYKKFRYKEVKTVLAGKVVCPRYAERDQAKPDPVKQSNAVAPNFVHSLDAAALMLTVEKAASEGVEHFGMVHDSYATLAADCALLAQCTREAFYGLYAERDVLQEFGEQLKPLVKKPEEFPPVPLKGNLDLGVVLVSEYFFS